MLLPTFLLTEMPIRFPSSPLSITYITSSLFAYEVPCLYISWNSLFFLTEGNRFIRFSISIFILTIIV